MGQRDPSFRRGGGRSDGSFSIHKEALRHGAPRNQLKKKVMATRRSAFSSLFDTMAEIFLFFGQITTLLIDSLWFILRGKISVRATLRQMSEVGVGSLFVAIVTVGFSGAVLALYTS